MELVPIIKTILFYGTIFFILVFTLSYILSKINNKKKSNSEKEIDLIPNYLNQPKPQRNIRVIKRSEPVVQTRRHVNEVKKIKTRVEPEKRRTVEKRRELDNPNIYYIKSHSRPQNTRSTKNFHDIQSGPTMDELKAQMKKQRFVVLNSNIQSSSDGLIHRFSKSYSYGR